MGGLRPYCNPGLQEKVFEDEWYLGDTFNTAIGQGFTLATPMQVAEMLAAVATDGKRYKPHLVSKIINDDGSVAERFEPQEEGSLPVSQKTLDLIQDGLRAVTEEGGTASALKSLPVDVAGKTGTAENPMAGTMAGSLLMLRPRIPALLWSALWSRAVMGRFQPRLLFSLSWNMPLRHRVSKSPAAGLRKIKRPRRRKGK